MGTHGYRSNYLEAFEIANHQLENIYSEYHNLQQRKEQLEGVLMALEAFLQSSPAITAESQPAEIAHPEPKPVHTEIYAALQSLAEPIARLERTIETPAAAAFAPAEEELDPLQLRINRALGLAVA
jgi:cell division septum initiation protein DivIVA